MKALRTTSKIIVAALLVSIMLTMAACTLFKGALKLESFTVDRSTVKTVYYVGEEIDFSGIEATAVYSDESLTKVYKYDELTITYDPDITATPGNKLVTVSFMDPNLNVEQKAQVQIVVSEDPNAPKHAGYEVDYSGMKTTYFVGETVDFTGVKVIEKFTNGGADVEMTDTSKIAYEYDENITATPGSKNIVVKYDGKSAGAITLTVKYPAVTVVDINTDNVKTEYMAGESLDLAGLTATVTYENGSSETVTEFTAGALDMSTPGDKTVSLSFTDPISGTAMSESLSIKVDGVVDYIINTDNVKLNYLIGDTVSFDGLIVSEDWYFADNKEIAFAELSFDCDETVTSVAGSKAINVIYDGKTVGRFNIEVAIPDVTDVTFSGIALEYNVGDSVSLDGLTALITYENGITRTVTDFTAVTDISSLTGTPGDKSIVVRFADPVSGNNAEKSLTVKVEGVTDYKLDTTGMTLEYLEGDDVSFAGIKVVAVYHYAGEVEVSFDALTFVHEDALTATAGNKTVTVKVGEDEVGRFIVKVGDIPTASVNSQDLDLSYRVGETASFDGLSITLSYTDGTSQEVVTSNIEIVTDLSSITAIAGTKTIVVKYLFDGEVELQASFEITVHGFTYQITPPAKTEYIAGGELDYTGFKVEKVYTDGGENVLVSDYTIDDADLTATAGEKQVAVSVDGATVGYVSFKVVPNSVTSEALTGNPVSARVNGTLDLSGLVLTVTYRNGDVVTLDYSELTVAHIDLSVAGTKTVEVSYYDEVNKVNDSTSFSITVYGVDSYTINTENVKTSYIAGDTVNYDGITILANYKDGGESVAVDLANVSYDVDGVLTTVGTTTVHVSLGGSVIGNFNLTVEKNTIESTVIGGTFDTSYEVGDTPDFSGITVTVTYKSGKVVELVYADLTIGAVDTSSAGTKTVTVSFTDEVNNESAGATFTVTVIEAKPTVTQFEKPGSLTSFEGDNKNAGSLNYGDTGFSGQFLNGGKLYVIGDDNEFKLNPLFSVFVDGSVEPLTSYYTNVDLYIHNGEDYVLLDKVADATRPTMVSYYNGEELFAVVDTYNGLYSFKTTAEKIKISVLPSEDYYVLNNNNPVVLEARVIDAYNVYEAWQLAVIDNHKDRTDWDAFKSDKGIAGVDPAGIVLHNDIHISASDVPASFFNVSDKDVTYYKIVDGAVVETSVAPAGTKYLIDGINIYRRTSTSDFVIEGNFFAIDTRSFPLIASPAVFDSNLELDYGDDYSNATLFMFEGTSHNWTPVTVPNVDIDNITFIGNASRDNWVDAETDGNLVTAGGLILIKSSRYANTTMTNTVNNSFFIAYFPDYTGTLNVEDSKCYDSYQNAAFVWADSVLNVNNSFINGSGGPVIISQSVKETVNGTEMYLNPVTNVNGTKAETHVTGEEIWFKAVGATNLIGNIKALGGGLDQLVSQVTHLLLGQSSNANWVDGQGKMNIKAILMPRGTGIEALTDGMIQGTATFDGAGFKRWYEQTENFNADWAAILQNPYFEAGAPFLSVTAEDGTVHTVYFIQEGESGSFYDMNGLKIGTQSPDTYAIVSAFAAADQVALHQGGLSVIFELYH